MLLIYTYRKPRYAAVVSMLIVAMLCLVWSAGAAALTPIELLGKHIFFDQISIPGNKQGCFSCHDPAKGWILPNSAINDSTVVAPGAKPHAVGRIKTPSNAYASFSSFPLPNSVYTAWEGGNFWDGRAEGCGATGGPCPEGAGRSAKRSRWQTSHYQNRPTTKNFLGLRLIRP